MSDRWLYGWSLGYGAVGTASLLVPLYALSLDASALLVGLIAATAAFAGVPGAILWGRLASRTRRRRPFVLVALGATAASLAVMPTLSSARLLLVANAVMWFVVSAAAPVLNLIVVEGVPTDQWESRFARLNGVQGYGWLGGLLLGAVWNALAPRFVGPDAAQRLLFFVVAATAALGLVVVRAWYPDEPTMSARRFERVYGRLRRTRPWGAGRYVRAVPFGPNRLYWSLKSLDAEGVRTRLSSPSPLQRYLVAVTLFFVGFSVFFGPLPAYLTAAGYSTDAIFLLFVLSSTGSALAYGYAGSLAASYDIRRLQSSALTTRAFAFPLVAIVSGVAASGVTGLAVVGVLFAVVGVTWAFIAVTATGLVSRLAPEEIRGEALGLYTALGGLGGGIGSTLGGVVADLSNYVVAFALAGALVLVSVALVLDSQA